MRKSNTIIAVLLVCAICFALCACSVDGANTTSETETPESKLWLAVQSRAAQSIALGATIGGKEIKYVETTITNYEFTSATECTVNGKIVMTDVYGTKWSNTFDCKLRKDSDGDWEAGSLEYVSNNWTKG